MYISKMFAFDLNILTEEEKKGSPFYNDCNNTSTNSSKKTVTRKQKNELLKKQDAIKCDTKKKLIFNIKTDNNTDTKYNTKYNTYKKIKKRK